MNVCDSIAVDSVIYLNTLWSSAPRGLALAYRSATLLVLYKEKKALVDGEGEEPPKTRGAETTTFTRITSSLFSYKVLASSSYYLRWVNLWNNFS